jgi:hypothetical protein
LFAANAAYPSWFEGVDPVSWEKVAILAAVAFAVGNIWFAFNRYGVHQFIDYLLYLLKSPSPSPSTDQFRYLDDLGRYVAESLYRADTPRRASSHVALRASAIFLLYTVAEAGVLFTVYHEPNTVFSRHPLLIIAASAGLFVVAFWQNIITRRIDHFVVTMKAPTG